MSKINHHAPRFIVSEAQSEQSRAARDAPVSTCRPGQRVIICTLWNVNGEKGPLINCSLKVAPRLQEAD